MICSALGEDAVTHETCKKWFQRFRNSDFDLSDRKVFHRFHRPERIQKAGRWVKAPN